jgi:hypothetical protein
LSVSELELALNLLHDLLLLGLHVCWVSEVREEQGDGKGRGMSGQAIAERRVEERKEEGRRERGWFKVD